MRSEAEFVTTAAPFDSPGKIIGSGEMADRIRSFPWQENPLGPIEGWPPELTTMVNMMLSHDGLSGVYWGPEKIFLYNDAYLPHLTDKHPALGKPYWDIWAEVVAQAKELLDSPVETGRSFTTPASPLKLLRNGVLEQTYYSINGSPIFAFTEGKTAVGGAYFTYTDQTANVLQAQELARTEARASRVLASIGDAVIVTDAYGRVTTLNSVAEELTGWSEVEAKGKLAGEVYQLLDPGTRKHIENPTESVLRSGTAVNLTRDTILVAKNGGERYIGDSGSPVRGTDGEVSGVVLVFRDVTQAYEERREKEAAAAMQQFLLKLTDEQRSVANGREIIEIASAALGHHLDVERVGYSEATADSRSMQFVTGWVRGGLQPLTGTVALDHWGETVVNSFQRGRTVIYNDVRQENLDSKLEAYLAINAISVLAVPLLRRGIWRGSLYVNHSEPRHWTAEEIILVEEVARRTAEAVERAHVEEELRALAGRLGMAQQAGQMTSWQWDLVNDSMIWDGGSTWTWGRSPAEMKESSETFAYILEEDRNKVRTALQPAIAGTGEYRTEFRVVWPDGSVHWLLAFGRTIWSYDGKPIGVVGINVNVTDQKHADAALMQTEKLAAVGRLASTMAHEINNPLEAITNLLYPARHSDNLEEAQPFLETADAELRRAAMITSQALHFHKQATRPTLCTFEQLTHELFKGRHSRLNNAGARVKERDRTSRPVLCFEGEIRQVLNNLVANAIDAFGGKGGKLLLRGRDGTDWKTGRAGMVLTVADTGSGMSRITQQKLFDAFFTTKGISGTGLGLWVSKEIIERHEGRIHLRSSEREIQHGTIFMIFLPYAAVVRDAGER